MLRTALLGVCVTTGLMAMCVHGCAEPTARTTSLAATSVQHEPTSATYAEIATVEKAVYLPVFGQLAESLSPVPVFGLEALPNDTEVAPKWWPVIEREAPADGVGGEENPRLVGVNDQEPEAQLLLTCGGGWLCIIENFRGDLGDVEGETIGWVGDSAACLYQVNGGWLVQWAYEGRWYGIFGRDVAREVVESTARAMTLVQRY